jgi:hypothetical protein
MRNKQVRHFSGAGWLVNRDDIRARDKKRKKKQKKTKTKEHQTKDIRTWDAVIV